jgi:hypothetical protein
MFSTTVGSGWFGKWPSGSQNSDVTCAEAFVERRRHRATVPLPASTTTSTAASGATVSSVR